MLSLSSDVRTTPLIEIFPGLVAKFELNSAGGSHKTRAARHIVLQGLESGEIIPGVTTIIEKTGGNFGFGLVLACSEIGVCVELAVGLGFSATKRQHLEFLGAKLIGVNMLSQGAKPRDVVEWHLENAQSMGKQYFYTDQFKNIGSLEAHLQDTGPEIARQLKGDFPEVKALTFVACAGTGASLTGISRSLCAAGYSVEVILVEPEGCDARAGIFVEHRFEGMSVGVPPPFLDWSLVSEVERVSLAEMAATQRRFSGSRGFFIGNTSAACLHVALRRSGRSQPFHKILTLIYDSGLWYMNSAHGATSTS